jgi:hydrogenase maturation protease
MRKRLAVVGIGNVLQFDDGVGVYASVYLKENFFFEPQIDIIEGGVEGIKLLDLFLEYEELLILDSINLNDKSGSIYNIPSHELQTLGLNSGSAHEIGVIETLGAIELMGKKPPNAKIIAIVPNQVRFEYGLSEAVLSNFKKFIQAILDELTLHDICHKKIASVEIEKIIEHYSDPTVRL